MNEPEGTFMGMPVYTASKKPEGKQYVTLMIFHGEAEGAMPNGTLVEKCNKEALDSYANGTLGTVIASLDVREIKELAIDYVYYVDWVPDPGVPVMIAGNRIRPAV